MFSSCVLVNPYYVCIDSNQVYSVNVVSESNLVHTFYLKDKFTTTDNIKIAAINAPDSIIHLQQNNENHLLQITEQGIKSVDGVQINGKKTFLVIPYGDTNCLVQGEHTKPGVRLNKFSSVISKLNEFLIFL